MDVKNIFKISSLGFLSGVKRTPESGLKLNSTSDRDGNGQTPRGRKSPLRDLSQEELEFAVKKLESMSPVLEHKWQIELLQEPDKTPEILVRDNLGNIIKRISTYEIQSLLETPVPHKGQILKKSA